MMQEHIRQKTFWMPVAVAGVLVACTLILAGCPGAKRFAKIRQMHAQHAEMMDVRDDIHDVLTPHQRALVRSQTREWRDGFISRASFFEEQRELWQTVSLSAEQRAVVLDIVMNHRDALTQAATDLGSARATLHRFVLNPDATQTELDGAAADVGLAIGQAASVVRSMLGEGRGVLTSEQQLVVEQMIPNRLASDADRSGQFALRLDEAFALWETLDLSPEQIGAIANVIKDAQLPEA
jgi:hypothetical protein